MSAGIKLPAEYVAEFGKTSDREAHNHLVSLFAQCQRDAIEACALAAVAEMEGYIKADSTPRAQAAWGVACRIRGIES